MPPSKEAVEHFAGYSPSLATLIIAFARALAFVMGALFSLTVGQIGMRMAVDANVRVASEARRSFAGALRIAYRAGTVTGMLTDGLVIIPGMAIGKESAVWSTLTIAFLNNLQTANCYRLIGNFDRDLSVKFFP